MARSFEGADAIYTMIPPKMDVEDWPVFTSYVADNYVLAIQKAGVRKIVHLSSMGAHIPEGAGPVSDHYKVEQKLNALRDVDVSILRPGSFYTNFLRNIGMIKTMGIIGSNYDDLVLPLVAPRDIAAAAQEELRARWVEGTRVRYVVSDERSTAEIAQVLGKAIGKPELPWIRFKDEDALDGMLRVGMSRSVAENLVQMGRVMDRGDARADFDKHRPVFGPTKLEEFAREFAEVYRRN